MTHATEETFTHIAEVVGRTVALRIFILELVAKLQIGGLHDGFAVGDTSAIVIVLLRSEVITVGLVGRVLSVAIDVLIDAHIVHREVARVVVAVATLHLHGDVSSCGTQFSIQLQCTSKVLVFRITQRAVISCIDKEIIRSHHVDSLLRERVSDIEIGVINECA